MVAWSGDSTRTIVDAVGGDTLASGSFFVGGVLEEAVNPRYRIRVGSKSKNLCYDSIINESGESSIDPMADFLGSPTAPHECLNLLNR